MTCPAFGSTSEVSLYYAVDADPSAAIPSDQVWKQVRITGESMDLNLSSTVSDEITPNRSVSDSILTQGEVSGGFTYDVTAENLDDFIISVLQANKDLLVDPAASNPWLDTETIKNASVKKCLMFLKRVQVGADTHAYVFRGCQVDSLSLSLESGAIISGEASVMGSGGAVSLAVGTWVYEYATDTPLMSAVSSLASFNLTDDQDAAIDTTFQSFTLTISNQMRQQFAVGTGNLFAAGIASGRIMVTTSTTQYYSSFDMYDQYVADKVLKLEFALADANGNGWTFDMDKFKAQGGVVPLAGGPDADLLVSPDMQAFEDSTNGTISITKDMSRYVNQPTNSSPANLDTGVTKTNPTLTSSAFAYTGTAQTHGTSQWQIIDDATGSPDFTSIVYDSNESTDKTTHVTSVSLTGLTDYHWRVRHRGADTGWSPWSATTVFTTAA